MRRCVPSLILLSAILCVSNLFAATSPAETPNAPSSSPLTLTLTSPFVVQTTGSGITNNYYGGGPLHIVASATSLGCVGGISAMLIYTADYTIAYESYSSYIDEQLVLSPTYYNVNVKVFDNCGAVADILIPTYLQSSSGTVTVNSPEANLIYSSPVYFNATGTTTCSSGISAMGVYTANNQLAYSVNGSSLSTTLKLSPGTYNLAIQEWDNCGGAANTLETITVASDGISSAPSFVYIPRTGSPWIDGYWVDKTSCALNTAAGSPFPAHYKPYGTAPDPLGKFVFAVNQDSQDVNIYTIDQDTGGLTQVPDSPVQVPEYGSLHPTAIAVDGKGRFVYVATGNTNQSGEIAGFSLDRSSGNLTLIPGSPFKMKNSAYGPASANYMTADRSGKYLYTGNVASVSGFSINQTTGALTEVPNSPFTVNGYYSTYTDTEDIIIDPANKHLYTANNENSVSGWTMNASNGELTEISGSPWIDPTIPSGVEFSPASITIDAQGTFMFGLDAGAEQISIWSVDASTGIVTFLSDEHNGQLIPDPLDKMRVIPGSSCMATSGGYALSFDPSTGATTIVPGSPFPLPGTGQEPGIAIAP